MKYFRDTQGRITRLTDERLRHMEVNHPEMFGQLEKIESTLLQPDIIVRSRTDPEVELFYKYYPNTPVTEKYLCVVVTTSNRDSFIVTSYFTDTIKRGEVLWESR